MMSLNMAEYGTKHSDIFNSWESSSSCFSGKSKDTWMSSWISRRFSLESLDAGGQAWQEVLVWPWESRSEVICFILGLAFCSWYEQMSTSWFLLPSSTLTSTSTTTWVQYSFIFTFSNQPPTHPTRTTKKVSFWITIFNSLNIPLLEELASSIPTKSSLLLGLTWI